MMMAGWRREGVGITVGRGWVDDGNTVVSIAGSRRAGYWCKNTILYCTWEQRIAELQRRGCDIDRLLRDILL